MKKLSSCCAMIAALVISLPLHAEDTLPASRSQVSPEREYPSPVSATRPQGVFVPAKHIAMVAPGMKKSEVYTLLDVPHFHEGLFGVRRWNYLLNFYTGNGDEFRQCQYQVSYDKNSRVEGAFWRDGECASLFEKQLATSLTERVVTKYAPVPVVEEKAARTFAFTFDFNKSDVGDEGRSVISQVVNEVARGKTYQKIVITGFTDTVGSQSYNDVLAAQRAAATVSQLTAALDAAGSSLASRVFARGGRELAQPTLDQVEERANRRVQIELF